MSGQARQFTLNYFPISSMHLQADLENGVDPDKPADLDFQNRIIPGLHDKG